MRLTSNLLRRSKPKPSVGLPTSNETFSGLLAQNGTTLPFYHVDVSVVRQQCKRWHKALPFVTPHYAVKCNPDPVVLRVMHECGAGYDCASLNEIQEALRFVKRGDVGGVAPTPAPFVPDILFANPIKEPQSIQQAAALGVHQTTADSVEELDKIAKYNPEAQVMLRILVDDDDSRCRLGNKYGAPMDQIETILLKAQALNIHMTGVSFHVGSGQTNPQAYASAIQRARVAFDIGHRCGHRQMNVLNLGGGFIDDPVFESVASVIRRSIEESFPLWQRQHRNGRSAALSIIAEPGRFFVSQSFKLVTKIIGRKGSMVYINDSVYGSFNNIMYDHALVQPEGIMSHDGSRVQWYDDGEEQEGEGQEGQRNIDANANNSSSNSASIWGQTCDGLDRITTSSSSRLNDADVGEWLIWPNMGAYTSSAASRFNGFEPPNVFYNMDGESVAELKVEAYR